MAPRDRAEERNRIAQGYRFVNYVRTSGKHYPPEFRPSRGREICEALGEPVRDHTASRCEPIGWVCARTVPGDSTMDCYFTGTEVRNPIHGKEDRFGRPRGTWAA